MDLLTYRAPSDLLRERVILVTGASSGSGRTAALAFAAHGASVILHGRDPDRLAAVYDQIDAAGGPRPALFPLDLALAGDRDFEGLAALLVIHAPGILCGRSDVNIRADIAGPAWSGPPPN